MAEPAGDPTAATHPQVYEDRRAPVRLVVDDCLSQLCTLDDACVDLVVTSPPYNLGIRYSHYSDDRDYTDYLSWLRQVFVDVARVLRADGSMFLNVGGSNTNPWVAYDVAAQARDLLALQNHIVWAKSVSVGDTTYGHFKPINSERFLNHIHEDVFHFTKTGRVKLDAKPPGPTSPPSSPPRSYHYILYHFR